MNNISKEAIESVIRYCSYDCEYRFRFDDEYKPYDGCTNNLLRILDDDETTIHKVSEAEEEYKAGYTTVKIIEPFMGAILLLRCKQ